MPEQPETLPPGVVRKGSRLVRTIPRTAADGSEWTEERPVALTLGEAKEKRFDYLHPELGWIRQGYKLERDRSAEAIMADISGPREEAEERAEVPAAWRNDGQEKQEAS